CSQRVRASGGREETFQKGGVPAPPPATFYKRIGPSARKIRMPLGGSADAPYHALFAVQCRDRSSYPSTASIARPISSGVRRASRDLVPAGAEIRTRKRPGRC